jgi:hypothetical protein
MRCLQSAAEWKGRGRSTSYRHWTKRENDTESRYYCILAPIFLSFTGKVVTRSRFPTPDVPQCWRSSREEGGFAGCVKTGAVETRLE